MSVLTSVDSSFHNNPYQPLRVQSGKWLGMISKSFNLLILKWGFLVISFFPSNKKWIIISLCHYKSIKSTIWWLKLIEKLYVNCGTSSSCYNFWLWAQIQLIFEDHLCKLMKSKPGKLWLLVIIEQVHFLH